MESQIMRVGAIHELKTWPPFFQDIIDGVKPFEIREDDRGYQVGDVLYLREFNPAFHEEAHPKGQYTGRSVYRLVIYKLDGAQYVGIDDNYCALGLSVLPHHVKVEIVRGKEPLGHCQKCGWLNEHDECTSSAACENGSAWKKRENS